MKNIKKIIVMLCVVMLIVMNFSTVSEAASGKMAIGLSSSSIKIGDTISVTVSISADAPIAIGTAIITYGKGVLEYIGCTSGDVGGSGTLTADVDFSENTKSGTIAILTFKAVANGTASISVSSSDMYDWDGNSVGISGASVNVTVASPQSDTPTNNNTEGNTSTDDNQTNTVNCNLSSLQISPGTLSPKFSSGTTKYTATVEEDITKIVVSATASNSNANVSVLGAGNLKVGANKVTITVTAPTGETKSYVITVTRGGESEEVTTEEENPDITVNIDGKVYTFALSADGLTVPRDFTASEGKYGEHTVLAFQSPNKAFKIVCLFDDSGTGVQYWYMLNEETGSLLPYIEYLANSNRYIIVEADNNMIPEGFTLTKYDLDGTSIDAYTDGNEDGFILVYAMTVYGEPVFYWYDTEEGTFQRYIERVIEEEVTEEEVIEEQPQKEDTILNMRDIIMYVAIGLATIFFIMCILLSIQLKNKSLNNRFDGEDNN